MKSPFVSLALLLTVATAAQATELQVLTHKEDSSIGEKRIVLKWHGDIKAPMAAKFREAYETRATGIDEVIVDLASEGGDVLEGEAVIKVLERVRAEKKLTTWVDRGEKCSSMCVPIFLQGEVRVAALVSSWMFHGARRWWTNVPDIAKTDELLDKHFRTRGVSEEFLQTLLPAMRAPGEYWLTGDDLMSMKSGIITNTLAKHRKMKPESLPIDPTIRPR